MLLGSSFTFWYLQVSDSSFSRDFCNVGFADHEGGKKLTEEAIKHPLESVYYNLQITESFYAH